MLPEARYPMDSDKQTQWNSSWSGKEFKHYETIKINTQNPISLSKDKDQSLVANAWTHRKEKAYSKNVFI